MTELENKLIEIGKRYFAIGVQVSNAYSAEQAKLQLELMLSGERLSSESGTIESLAAINQIAELTKVHKETYQKILMAFSSEQIALISEFPEAEKNEKLTGMVATLNRNLAMQSNFYEAREQWIDATTKICNLMQNCRGTTIFSDTVQFANDEEFDEFDRQMARVESAHQEEVRLMNEKMKTMSKSLEVLGIQVSSK